MINRLIALMEKVDNMQEQMENVSRDGDSKKQQKMINTNRNKEYL